MAVKSVYQTAVYAYVKRLTAGIEATNITAPLERSTNAAADALNEDCMGRWCCQLAQEVLALKIFLRKV